MIARIVQSGSRFLAGFFPTAGNWGGPPYPVDRAAAGARLASAFVIERELEPIGSPKPRRRLVWLVYAVRR